VAQFNDWCLSVDERVGNHFRRVMTAQAASLATGIQATAVIVPVHYASEEQVARALARLGKPATAALIQGKLPTTIESISGPCSLDLRAAAGGQNSDRWNPSNAYLHACRIAESSSSSGHVTGDHAAGADQRIVGNGNAGQNDRTRPDPHVVPNVDLTPIFETRGS
jgi:hypothetical protein